jgi:acyl-coenzyme A thioesterase PaaI-like protein
MNSVYEEHGAMGSHRYCLLCGSENPLSMRLSFRNNQDGSVTADFQSHNHLQGYNGIMHGGVISALLDSVMTNCLFRNGIEAVTGELTVKFFESVPCNARVHLSAKIEKSIFFPKENSAFLPMCPTLVFSGELCLAARPL